MPERMIDGSGTTHVRTATADADDGVARQGAETQQIDGTAAVGTAAWLASSAGMHSKENSALAHAINAAGVLGRHESAVVATLKQTGLLRGQRSAIAQAAAALDCLPKEPAYLKNFRFIESIAAGPVIPRALEQIFAATDHTSLKNFSTIESAALFGKTPGLLASVDKVLAGIRPAHPDHWKTFAALDIAPDNRVAGIAAMLGTISEALGSVSKLDTQTYQLAAGSSAIAGILADFNAHLGSTRLLDGVSAYAGANSLIAGAGISEMLRGVSLPGSTLVDSYLGGLGTRPLARRASLAGLAAQVVASEMVSEALLAPDLDGEDLDLLVERSDAEVLEPWRQGQADLQAQLYDELHRINPAIPDRLKGAWDDIVRDGPAAVSKVANCLSEAIDWTLRSICEGVDLVAWLSEQGLKGGRYVDGLGRPTVTARAMYAVRSRSRRDRRLVVSLEEGVVAQLVALRDAVEGHKHGGAVVSVFASGIRSHAVSAEALLAALLGL